MQTDKEKFWHIDDLKAGALMSVILLVQGIAYAQIAQLPIQYGLYAALIGPLLYLIVGSMNQISIGPVAIDALLIGTCLSTIYADNNTSISIITFHLVVSVGIIQLIGSITPLYIYLQKIPEAILKGFITGGAIAIVISQTHIILHISSSKSSLVNLVSEVYRYGLQVSIGQSIGIFLLFMLLS